MLERGLSERRSLAVAHMSASAFRYEPRPDRNVELREQIQALANRHKRYGVGMFTLGFRRSFRFEREPFGARRRSGFHLLKQVLLLADGQITPPQQQSGQYLVLGVEKRWGNPQRLG